MNTLVSDGFDYPIGNADGKGKCKSTTNFTENYELGVLNETIKSFQ
jgi:hypothetical protein